MILTLQQRKQVAKSARYIYILHHCQKKEKYQSFNTIVRKQWVICIKNNHSTIINLFTPKWWCYHLVIRGSETTADDGYLNKESHPIRCSMPQSYLLWLFLWMKLGVRWYILQTLYCWAWLVWGLPKECGFIFDTAIIGTFQCLSPLKWGWVLIWLLIL